MSRNIAILLLSVVILAACEHDAYETGDSRYSYLRADFVEAHTNSNKGIYQAVNDDGETITLASPLSVSWATKADTTYRALLYYDKKDERVQGISISRIPVVQYATVDTIGSDPLTFQSAWMSKNGKYLNIGFAVKTGKADGEDATQEIGMVCDSVKTSPLSPQTLYLRLTHAQNNVPQYYSARGYISVPTHQLPDGTNIVLRVNDYEGVVEKTFTVKF